MFATTAKRSSLAQRTLDALRLTRSFLMLEDDYDVDWEVDRDEPQAHDHPHRAPLRGPGRRSRRIATRRPGAVAREPQHCVSPVGQRQFAASTRTNRRTEATDGAAA